VTVRAFIESKDPTRIDLNNKIDPKTGVRYLGHAWFCMADVGALCVVEVKLVDDPEATPPSDSKESLRP